MITPKESKHEIKGSTWEPLTRESKPTLTPTWGKDYAKRYALNVAPTLHVPPHFGAMDA